MDRKFHFNKVTRLGGISLIMGIAISIAIIDIVCSYHDFSVNSTKLRSDFIDKQKEIIKQEVIRVAEIISHEKSRSQNVIINNIKLRGYEAEKIAENIYTQNQATKDHKAILTMIKDALRPIRFEEEKGFFFMISFDGTVLLSADHPETEEKKGLTFRILTENLL